VDKLVHAITEEDGTEERRGREKVREENEIQLDIYIYIFCELRRAKSSREKVSDVFDGRGASRGRWSG